MKRAEEIEQKLIEGQVVVDLDTQFIDASFVADRMDATEEQNTLFREMIREHGQAVPILVRPKRRSRAVTKSRSDIGDCVRRESSASRFEQL